MNKNLYIMEEEFKEIINSLESNKNLGDNEIADAIKTLGILGKKEAIPYLIERLKNNFDNVSWKIKNAIAISLGDLGADEAVPYLMNVVKNKAYKGYNGSFLYALSIKPLKCKEYFLDFIELLCTGSLEIRSAAAKLIEYYHEQVATDIKQVALNILRTNKILLEANNIGKEKYGTLEFIESVENVLNRKL